MRTADKISSLGDIRRRFRSETEKECRVKKEGIISQMAQGPQRGRTMEKDLVEVACASLGFAAFIAKRRKSPGLDLR